MTQGPFNTAAAARGESQRLIAGGASRTRIVKHVIEHSRFEVTVTYSVQASYPRTKTQKNL
jgi:hypothetical protein